MTILAAACAMTITLCSTYLHSWEQGEPPVTLENMLVVDKTVLFMHNVGATQELVRHNDNLRIQVQARRRSQLQRAKIRSSRSCAKHC